MVCLNWLYVGKNIPVKDELFAIITDSYRPPIYIMNLLLISPVTKKMITHKR